MKPNKITFRVLVMWLGSLLTLLTLFAPTPTASYAQRPDAPTYAMRGSYPVGVTDFTVENGVRPLTVTMWYPALNPDHVEEVTTYQIGDQQRIGHALRNATPDMADGPYPVIYFSHGFGTSRLHSTYYTEHLASWGFVVIAADHPGSTFSDLSQANRELGILQSFALRPLEILRLIEYSDIMNTRGNFAGLLDMDNLAVTGHSFGGYTALAVGGAQLDVPALKAACATSASQVSRLCDADLDIQARLIAAWRGLDEVPAELWPTTTDPRIKAVVALAPAWFPVFGPAGMDNLTAPLMVLVGSNDTAAPLEINARPAFETAGSPTKSLAVFQNASHQIFIDACLESTPSRRAFSQCSDAVWDMARVHDLINHLTTAFFLAHLKGDPAASAALTAESVDFAGLTYQTAPRY